MLFGCRSRMGKSVGNAQPAAVREQSLTERRTAGMTKVIRGRVSSLTNRGRLQVPRTFLSLEVRTIVTKTRASRRERGQ
jgi:hypothetical protein